MIRALLAVVFLSLGNVAWAQAPKQKAIQTKEQAQPSAMAAELSTDPQSTSATYGDWVLVCRRLGDVQRPVCEVTQQIQVQGQPGPIAQLAIAKSAALKELRLVVVLPNNVSLRSEPRVANGEASEREINLAWLRCVPGGCFADADLSEDATKEWRNSTERGRIAFKDGIGRDVTIPISFRGLSPALDALGKQD